VCVRELVHADSCGMFLHSLTRPLTHPHTYTPFYGIPLARVCVRAGRLLTGCEKTTCEGLSQRSS
jgi:hypothetical protein